MTLQTRHSAFINTTANQIAAQPRRRWAPRVRTGCLTCRKRRVKCDEGKPLCRRCVGSGNACEGYELPDAAPVMIMTSPLWRVGAPSAKPPPAELELSWYFRRHLLTTDHDEFSLDLWRGLVAQAADSQAAMWHATNAVAAIGLYRSRPAEPAGEDAAAALYQQGLRQYSLSLYQISDLIKHSRMLAAEEQTAVLLANCLLAHCCLSYGDYVGVFSLAVHSSQLIHYWRYWQHVNIGPAALYASYVILQNIKVEPIFREVREVRIRGRTRPTTDWTTALIDVQQRPCLSLTDIYMELEMMWATLRGIVTQMPLWPTSDELRRAELKRDTVKSCLARWDARYGALEKADAPRQIRALHATIQRALAVRRIMVGVLLKISIGTAGVCWDDTCWDVCEADFRRALAVAEDAPSCHYPPTGDEQVQQEQQQRAAGPSAKPRPYSALLWKCLHTIACVCRHPTIRRDAAAILQRQLYNIGPTDPQPHSLWGEILALEEAAWKTCSVCVRDEYVCNQHRVVRIVARQLTAGLTEKRLLTVGDLLHGKAGSPFIIMSQESKPPFPPFTLETARIKVKAAQDAWNTKTPDTVKMAYTPDTIWRNRDQFLRGRDEVRAFLANKWSNENGYRLRKELFAFTDDKIAVQFWYEWHDEQGQWWRTYGLEDWTFAENGLMRKRQMSGNDVKISEEERWFKDGVDVNTVDISERHW
ncbi:hypothetical protein PWT90_08092 [Aphanocladium album]|nr:hypothetical protein PWT90_08092 [Aphanocladium album]